MARGATNPLTALLHESIEGAWTPVRGKHESRSLLGSGVPVIHMMGAGLVGGRIANSGGVFFWVWTLIALGVTAIFSVILSARGLWSRQWGQSR